MSTAAFNDHQHNNNMMSEPVRSSSSFQRIRVIPQEKLQKLEQIMTAGNSGDHLQVKQSKTNNEHALDQECGLALFCAHINMNYTHSFRIYFSVKICR